MSAYLTPLAPTRAASPGASAPRLAAPTSQQTRPSSPQPPAFRYFDLPKEVRHHVLQKLPPPPARQRQLGELGRLHGVSRAFRRDCRAAFPGFYEGLSWSRSLRAFAAEVAAEAPAQGQAWRREVVDTLHARGARLVASAVDVGVVDLAGVALPADHGERRPSCFWVRQLLDELLRLRPRLNVFILDDFPLRGWRCDLAGRDLRLDLLSLRGRPSVELPDGLHVTGDLDLTRQDLAYLPRGLRVDGNLVLRDCTELRALPPDLWVGGKLLLHGCARLVEVPASIYVGGDVEVRDCLRLRRFLLADTFGCLSISYCPNLVTLGTVLFVGKDLLLRYLPCLERLPEATGVAEDATFCHLLRLRGIGAELDLGFSLRVHACALLERVCVPVFSAHVELVDCPSLREFPATQVLGDLLVQGCPELGRVEELREIGGNAELLDSPQLRLGEVVAFGGNLFIDGSTMTRVPAGWQLASDVTLVDTYVETLPRPWHVRGDLHLGHTRGESLVLDHLEVEGDLVLEDVRAAFGRQLRVLGQTLLRHACHG